MRALYSGIYNMLHIYLDNLILGDLVNNLSYVSIHLGIVLHTMCTACTNSYQHELS